jgi:crotonobetainyl-CoA:carnitine CoA-transferase CaiB-like acyl-CoA transferase
VRARSGLTNLWRYPDDPEGFCDAITIYPDHTAARVGATAALAALIAARATGRGKRDQHRAGRGDAHAVRGRVLA